MTYVDWNGEPLPQEHQSPEKFEMDAEFYPKRVAELEQQLVARQADLERERQRRWDGNRLASLEYAEVSRELAECQAREKMRIDALKDEATAWTDIKLHAAKIGDDWLGTFADTMLAAITKELE